MRWQHLWSMWGIAAIALWGLENCARGTSFAYPTCFIRAWPAHCLRKSPAGDACVTLSDYCVTSGYSGYCSFRYRMHSLLRCFCLSQFESACSYCAKNLDRADRQSWSSKGYWSPVVETASLPPLCLKFGCDSKQHVVDWPSCLSSLCCFARSMVTLPRKYVLPNWHLRRDFTRKQPSSWSWSADSNW